MKKLLKNIFYYSGMYTILTKIIKPKGIFILFYHRLKSDYINNVDYPVYIEYSHFAQHLSYLKKAHTIINLDEAVSIMRNKNKLNKSYVVITFDDGYKDNYLYGYDLFKAHKIEPMIYLAVNNIEKQYYLWFDLVMFLFMNTKEKEIHIDIINKKVKIASYKEKLEVCKHLVSKLKDFNEDEKNNYIKLLAELLNVEIPSKCGNMLNWDDINKLHDIKTKFGSHTLNHCILTRINQLDLISELCDSKKIIESKIKSSVRHFAYPNGTINDFNNNIKNVVLKYYDTAVTTIHGANFPGDDLYKLKRVGLGYKMKVKDLKLQILTAYVKSTFKIP